MTLIPSSKEELIAILKSVETETCTYGFEVNLSKTN